MVLWPQNKKTEGSPRCSLSSPVGSGGTSAWVSGERISPEQWASPGLAELRPKQNNRGCSSSWDAWGGVIPGGKTDPDPHTASCSLERSLVLAWAVMATGEQHRVRIAQGLWVWFTVRGACFWGAGCPCGTALGRDNPFNDSERCGLLQRDSIMCLRMQTLESACLYLNPAVSFIGCVTLGEFKISMPQFLHGTDKKTKWINTNYVRFQLSTAAKHTTPKWKVFLLLMILQLKHCSMGNAFLLHQILAVIVLMKLVDPRSRPQMYGSSAEGCLDLLLQQVVRMFLRNDSGL